MNRPKARFSLNPGVLNSQIILGGPAVIVGSGEDRSGAPYLRVRLENGKTVKVTPRKDDFRPVHPRQFEIRRKEYDFYAAPDLNGLTAWYEAGWLNSEDVETISAVRHKKAIDAAREAAREDYAAHGFRKANRSGYVRCHFEGERPAGTMKHGAYVSYRVRI